MTDQSGSVPNEKLSTAKFVRCIEAFFEIVAQLLGLCVVYFIFEFVGKHLVGDDFRSDTLLSLVVLPAIYVLKDIYIIFEPYFVDIELTDENVTVESGVLTKRLDCLNLKNVENVEQITSPVGRLFNYSTLNIYAYGSWVELPFVENPQSTKDRIEKGITKRSSKDAAS